MASIEEKLAKYRLKKEEERKAALLASVPLWQRYLPVRLQRSHQRVDDFAKNYDDQTVSQVSDQCDPSECKEHPQTLQGNRSRPTLRKKLKICPPKFVDEEDVLDPPESAVGDPNGKMITRVLLALKIILWIVLCLLSIEVEFGAVFTVLSIFYVILTNMRDGRRRAGEPSAYSVFNPGCEAIDGTLNADQFERELRHGM